MPNGIIGRNQEICLSKFGDMTIAEAVTILEAKLILKRQAEELRRRADALGHTSVEDGERFQVE